MIRVVCSVYDTACAVYMRPIFALSDAEAVRTFSDISVAADHPIGEHPEDYSLVRLGTFDDTKGIFVMDEDRVTLITGLEAVASMRKVAIRTANGGPPDPDDVTNVNDKE